MLTANIHLPPIEWSWWASEPVFLFDKTLMHVEWLTQPPPQHKFCANGEGGGSGRPKIKVVAISSQNTSSGMFNRQMMPYLMRYTNSVCLAPCACSHSCSLFFFNYRSTLAEYLGNYSNWSKKKQRTTNTELVTVMVFCSAYFKWGIFMSIAWEAESTCGSERQHHHFEFGSI